MKNETHNKISNNKCFLSLNKKKKGFMNSKHNINTQIQSPHNYNDLFQLNTVLHGL